MMSAAAVLIQEQLDLQILTYLLLHVSSCLYVNYNRPKVVQTNSLTFRSTSLGHLAILLLLSGQVETNPCHSAVQEYPCAVCGYEVHENDHAILCDSCNYCFFFFFFFLFISHIYTG